MTVAQQQCQFKAIGTVTVRSTSQIGACPLLTSVTRSRAGLPRSASGSRLDQRGRGGTAPKVRAELRCSSR